MSSLGNGFLEIMSRKSLWVRVLSSSPLMEPETRDQVSDRIGKATDKLQSASSTRAHKFGGSDRLIRRFLLKGCFITEL